LVPYVNAASLPLLPFEKQLIDLLGCSEEEYRRFAAEAAWRGRVRPAEYAHVPNVQNTTAEIIAIVSLVIGVASTALSIILRPKPKGIESTPSQRGRGADDSQSRQLDSISGTDRFSPTTGFDTQAELANYGDVIPLIFGRRTATTGGILVSPKLVWSRMFSYGKEQAVKLMYVVGEQGYAYGGTYNGILPPDLEGIFIGNGALDTAFSSTFAFYWKRNTTTSGFSRIKGANLLYGSRASGGAGDPQTADDIFSCPTRVSETDTGFCSAHSLTNNAAFGCFGAIPNGTGYRVNWSIVSTPWTIEGYWNDPGNTLLLERIKIAGNANEQYSADGVRGAGMPGTGRNYSRRMGITALNGVTVPDSVGTQERSVSIGDTILFTISPDKLPTDFYAAGSVKIEDINSAIDEDRIAADDALQVGEIFMIARTVWKVVSRRISLWRPEDNQAQQITLECIDILGRNTIGLVSGAVLSKNYLTDIENSPYFIGPSFYPLLRCNFGLVRNTRACDITEIGLRSQVYQRLNGIANFQSLPSPEELLSAELSRIQLQTGSNSSYIRRSSAFTIYLRPAGVDENGNSYPWVGTGIRFVVVGSTPVDQYNYIKFKHPETRQYEYKFIPKNGADMSNTSGSADFWLLNSSASALSVLTEDVNTSYGRFTISAPAVKTYKTQLQQNLEFLNKATPGTSGTSLSTKPDVVAVAKFYPEEEANATYPASLAYVGVTANPATVSEGKMASFAWEIFGSADTSPVASGGTTTATTVEIVNTRTITIRYTARKTLRIGHYSGENYTWDLVNYEVVSATGNWVLNEQFVAARDTSISNPFRNAPGGPISSSGVFLQVNGVRTVAQVQGRSQGLYEEFFGPARVLAVGSPGTHTLTYTKAGAAISITLASTTYSNPNHWSGAGYLWQDPTITVVASSTVGTWAVDETFDVFRVVSATNPFRSPGSTVGAQFKIVSVAAVTLPPGLVDSDRAFEGSSQYADTTFYKGLVDKSNQSAPEHTISYVNELVANETVPTYDRMTVAGLALKASRSFSSLDQVRFWLSDGIPVKRFHPDDNNSIGPSNLICDLIFHLLTDDTAGAGRLLQMTPNNASLINTTDFATTAKFLRTNKLFFDGSITAPINLRSYISELAPNFLCNFVISAGKFSLVPALPTTVGGSISTGPIVIKGLFTAGNILEDTFELEYLNAEERQDFQAIIRYRSALKNQLPEEKTLSARWATTTDYAPVESFDLTNYCTSVDHAKLVAKFFLSIRRRITHTIKFRTTPYGVDLAPGDYIKVATEASPYNAARNGTISADGTITSVSQIANGSYQVIYYAAGSEDIATATMTVSGGKVTQSALFNSVFTIQEVTTSENIYLVEQLTLSEEGLVEVAASEFPCNANLSSLVAQDVLTDSLFVFEN
jgi:hypothetical protein